MVELNIFRQNVLTFLDFCYPSEGVFDAIAWEKSGENSIFSETSKGFIRPESERKIVVKTLQERIDKNDWIFSSTPGGCESLEGGRAALETYYFMGELGKLSKENKKAWVDYFNQYQDRETGYYLAHFVRPKEHRSWKDPSVNTHPWTHMQDQMISGLCPSLMLLDGKSRYKLSEGSMTGRFLDKKYLEEYLWGRDWNNYKHDLNFRRHNPWWIANDFWHSISVLWQISIWEAGSAAGNTAKELIEKVWFKWHDDNMGVTGFWYGDLKGKSSNLWYGKLPEGSIPTKFNTVEEWDWIAIQIMGGVHQLWHYDFLNHPIPEEMRRKQTDYLLSLQNKYDNRFGLGSPSDDRGSNSVNCTDVDCMTILAMNYFKQDYRRIAIEKSLHDAAASILDSKLNRFGVLESSIGDAFAHCFNSYETYSPAGWGNVLNQSFYLWALMSAFAVVKKSDNPLLQTFLDYEWPQVSSHWLWVPKG